MPNDPFQVLLLEVRFPACSLLFYHATMQVHKPLHMELKAQRPVEQALTVYLGSDITLIVEDYRGRFLPHSKTWKYCRGGTSANTTQLELSAQGTFHFTKGMISRAGQDGREVSEISGTYCANKKHAIQ